jgi:Probable Zinc-ribbon domain
MCDGKKVCEMNSLRYRRPDLTDEWCQPKNGAHTPDNVTPGMPLKVYWMSLNDKKHKPFPQGIAMRDAMHQGCPKCFDEERKERARVTARERDQSQRARAAKIRGVATPPVLDDAARKETLVAGGKSLMRKDAAAAIGRSDATILNWIHSGRIRAHSPAAPGGPYLIPESEALRVRAILGLADDPGLEAA